MKSHKSDPNMETAYLWAIEPFLPIMLPYSLRNITRRAEFVNDLDIPDFINCLELDFIEKLTDETKFQTKVAIADWSRQFMPRMSRKDRISISLRLWSGCISAAKTIAEKTMSGPNTPETRRRLIKYIIDPRCKIDPIYRAGVEAAPAFRKLRNQRCFFKGVPKKFIKKIGWSL